MCYYNYQITGFCHVWDVTLANAPLPSTLPSPATPGIGLPTAASNVSSGVPKMPECAVSTSSLYYEGQLNKATVELLQPSRIASVLQYSRQQVPMRASSLLRRFSEPLRSARMQLCRVQRHTGPAHLAV
ncbi:MAG: hypothetical protein M1814_005098 [Vezdaea aestivalis]|nr:MAG: hypothetical protein M1814_005098 [Vezdaea aestivalis]